MYSKKLIQLTSVVFLIITQSPKSYVHRGFHEETKEK